jgi:hypothetical protein
VDRIALAAEISPGRKLMSTLSTTSSGQSIVHSPSIRPAPMLGAGSEQTERRTMASDSGCPLRAESDLRVVKERVLGVVGTWLVPARSATLFV